MQVSKVRFPIARLLSMTHVCGHAPKAAPSFVFLVACWSSTGRAEAVAMASARGPRDRRGLEHGQRSTSLRRRGLHLQGGQLCYSRAAGQPGCHCNSNANKTTNNDSTKVRQFDWPPWFCTGRGVMSRVDIGTESVQALKNNISRACKIWQKICTVDQLCTDPRMLTWCG